MRRLDICGVPSARVQKTMSASLSCVYCSKRAVQISRTPEGCRVHCRSCGHVWRSDDSEISDDLALRTFAMRAALEA